MFLNHFKHRLADEFLFNRFCLQIKCSRNVTSGKLRSYDEIPSLVSWPIIGHGYLFFSKGIVSTLL